MGSSARESRFGFAEMLRDVLVASISRGQFPFALLGMVTLMAILKMPSADVSRLVFRVVEILSDGQWLGYAFAVLFLLGWAGHVSVLRHALERVAVARERVRRRANVAEESEEVGS